MSVVHVNSISGITSITTPSSNDVLTLHTSNNAERLRIKSDGKVGINTATPGAQLEVKGSGSSNTLSFLTKDVNRNNVFWIKDGGRVGLHYSPLVINQDTGDTHTPSGTYFYVHHASNPFIIKSDGKVGVGKTNPDGVGVDVLSSRTTAYAGSQDQRSLAHIIARNTSDAPNRFASISLVSGGGTQAEGSINLVQTANYTGDIAFKSRTAVTSWSEKLRIKSDGGIGIGTEGTVHGISKLTIRPANRTTAFDASDGDSWHDVVLKQTGSATNNAIGLAFETSTQGYHKNAGTGIACVKNGTNSDFGADLVFITRPQSAVAAERLRIKSDGNIVATGNIKSNNLPGRNLIINGAMQVAQRKPSGEYTGQASYATVDRMYGNYSVPNTDPITECHVLTSSDTGPWEKGFRKSYRMKIGYQGSTAAGYYYQFQYRVEGQDIANSGWDYTSSSSYITLSFWVKSSVAYNPSWFIRSKHGTEKIYRFQPGTLTANTWTKVTQTIPGNSGITMNDDNTHGLQINLSPYWGTNYTSANPSMETWETFDSATRAKDTVATWFTTNGSTMEITGLQLEVGSIATEFEHLPYAEHLRRCQRYFHRLQGDQGDRAGIGGCCVNSTEARMNVTFPVTMRALPGISGSGTAQFDAENDSADFNCDDMTIESAPTGLIHSLGLQIVTSSMTGGQGGNMRFRSNGSYLDFSAEL